MRTYKHHKHHKRIVKENKKLKCRVSVNDSNQREQIVLAHNKHIWLQLAMLFRSKYLVVIGVVSIDVVGDTLIYDCHKKSNNL